MQPPDLDPNRPHGLDDILERLRTEGSWTPSWADVCRVREYIGGSWPQNRDGRNVYAASSLILHHLEDVQQVYARIAPYMTVACGSHAVPIGTPCGYEFLFRGLLHQNLALPDVPRVCTWRVLAKHDRLAALEFFERRSPAHGRTRRLGYDILSITAEPSEKGGARVETARIQYRNPQPFDLERLVVSRASDWLIRDIRIGGASILAPHHDLPGALFSNDVLGPCPPLPILAQDAWIEIEARPLRDKTLPFQACLIGTIQKEKKITMIEPTDKASLQELQEQHEQRAISHLAACERVRKKLELPIETLPLIDQILQKDFHRAVVPQTFTPWDAPAVPLRSPLRLLSEKKIQRTDPITGRPTAVHARPYTHAMRIEEIEILSAPDDWMIADIQVGGLTQFPQHGPPLPGRLFAPGGTCHHFRTDSLQTAMDLTFLVHYVGPDAEGSIFEAVAMGTLAR